MKKYFLLATLFFITLNCTAQNYYFASPEGYGAATTGGGNATPVTVTTYIDFKNALNSTSAANSVILVSGIIDCVYTSVTLNNKTIIGLPGAKLRNLQITPSNSSTSAANSGILNIKPGSNNVIIRNLIFEGPGAFDVDGRDNLTNEGTNIWVDHCEFQDGIDGNFDNKGTADNVTISWCKFTYLKAPIAGGSGGSADHRFTNLIGSAANDAPSDGKYSITFQNCYWASGCKDRMPRARNAQLHILNSLYNVNVSGSKGVNLGGGINGTTCYVENTHFKNIGSAYVNASGDGGTVAVNFINNINGAANVGTVTAPTYTYTTMPVAEVEARLTSANCGAGATLVVSSTGVISPSVCNNLGTAENNTKVGVSVYPSSTKDKVNFNFSNNKKGVAKIDFFASDGRKIHSITQHIKTKGTVQVDVENWMSGVYFCKVDINEISKNLKFIKH